jgi:hypothetical protein
MNAVEVIARVLAVIAFTVVVLALLAAATRR